MTSTCKFGDLPCILISVYEELAPPEPGVPGTRAFQYLNPALTARTLIDCYTCLSGYESFLC